MSKVTAYQLARQFHERYMAQFPPPLRQPWSMVSAEDRRLRIEAAGEVLRWLEGEEGKQ